MMTKDEIESLFNEKIKIFYLLLLFCYPIINYILLNYSQIQFISILFFLFFIFIVTLFVLTFLLLNFVFKKNNLVFKLFLIFSSFWNLELFYYNIKNYFLIFGNRYDGYISLLIIIILSFLFYELFKNRFFQRFLIIFILINLSLSLINNNSFNFFNEKKINLSTSKNYLEKINDKSNIHHKPNIFYIITDAMGSFDTLKKYEIDTKSIDNYLAKIGYKIAYNSKSSYTETRFTISSILYLDYILDGVNKFYSNESTYYPYFKENQQIPLINELKNIGYNFFRVENNYAKCSNHMQIKCYKTTNKHLLNRIINDYSIEVFFSNSFFYQTIKTNIDRDTSNPFFNDGYDTIQQYKKIFSDTKETLKSGGNFVLIHHMSPHRPMRDKNCKILNHREKMIFSPKNYKSSVNCVFKRIKEINEIIISEYPNSIIVFQGDHGPTFEDNKDMGSSNKPNVKHLKNRINIFNAMKIPKNCEKNFYNRIGSVETIKLILNCVGAKHIKPGKNSKTFMFFPHENPKIFNIDIL